MAKERSRFKDRGICGAEATTWMLNGSRPKRNKGVFGSLTLGGYDAARFTPNNVSFDLAPDISRDLVVGLQGIISSESNGSQNLLLPSPHLTFIDSTIPYLYMPLEACVLFEQALGIKWNESEQLYIVDEELHRNLLMRKPKFTFELGNSLTGGATVDIVLPYSSFDLTFKPTYDSEPVRYFPLQRAENKSQLTLGRSFLQEAYLITDYEHGNFSVSQCTFEEPMTENILPILPSGSREAIPQPTNSQQQTASSEGRHGRRFHFAIGVIVGSVLGLLFLLCISYGVYLRCFRRRRNRASGPKLSRCSSDKVQQMFANNDDSAKALQSTSSFQSDIEASKNGGIVTREIDTNDWDLTREIPDSGRTELPENCEIFELPQSVSPEPIHGRPENFVTLQPSPSRKRRWGLHFSTDGLLSTGNFIKCWMGLTELHTPPKEAATGAETSSKEFRPGKSYLDRPLPPTPISESPMRLSYHVWTRVAERRHEEQDSYPSPLMAPDDRYKHRQGFF
ncbi:MAG: hypothetical protein Q9221_004784 [Calogaya cf. arnoldii]